MAQLLVKFASAILNDIGDEALVAGGVDVFTRVNDELSDDQKVQLKIMLSNALAEYRAGRPYMPFVRAITALVISDGDKAAKVVQSVLKVLGIVGSAVAEVASEAIVQTAEELAERAAAQAAAERQKQEQQAAAAAPSVQAMEAKATAEQKLSKDDETTADKQLDEKYGITKEKIKAIPTAFKPSLLRALAEGPVCCITMEPLVNAKTGKIESDVAVIFQETGAKIHAFLYKKSAIERWLNSKKTNPATNNVINTRVQFYVLG